MNPLRLPTGVGHIQKERLRQIQDKDYTAEHDDEHDDGSLADCAAMIAKTSSPLNSDVQPAIARPWQYERAAHVRSKYRNDRVRQLSIAGALIAAEIDRLQRLGG